jgi:hypothetical protein
MDYLLHSVIITCYDYTGAAPDNLIDWGIKNGCIELDLILSLAEHKTYDAKQHDYHFSIHVKLIKIVSLRISISIKPIMHNPPFLIFSPSTSPFLKHKSAIKRIAFEPDNETGSGTHQQFIVKLTKKLLPLMHSCANEPSPIIQSYLKVSIGVFCLHKTIR